MLHPSYSELMEILNDANEMDSKITSRYAVVIAVAKRARQLINGSQPLARGTTDKAVSVAVAEMGGGFVNAYPQHDRDDDAPGTLTPTLPKDGFSYEKYTHFISATTPELLDEEYGSYDDEDYGDENVLPDDVSDEFDDDMDDDLRVLDDDDSLDLNLDFDDVYDLPDELGYQDDEQ